MVKWMERTLQDKIGGTEENESFWGYIVAKSGRKRVWIKREVWNRRAPLAAEIEKPESVGIATF